MPYSKCPICGNVSHLSVVDPAAWYAERFPEVKPGGMVAAPCFYCFTKLEVGDNVEIYRNFSEHPEWAAPGSFGTIRSITQSEHGAIYHLDVEGGKDAYFTRGKYASLEPVEAVPTSANAAAMYLSCYLALITMR